MAAILDKWLAGDEQGHRAESAALTDILNRRALLPLIEAEHSRSTRHRNPFPLSILDVDNFKSVNYTHGHAGGDSEIGLHLRNIEIRVKFLDTLLTDAMAELGLGMLLNVDLWYVFFFPSTAFFWPFWQNRFCRSAA